MALFRVDQIMEKFNVHESAFKGEPVVNQDVSLKFQVVSIFLYR